MDPDIDIKGVRFAASCDEPSIGPKRNSRVQGIKTEQNYHNPDMSAPACYIGSQVASSASAAFANHRDASNVSQEGAEFLRNSYCEIFNLQSRDHSNNPLWWQNQFGHSGEVMVHEFMGKVASEPSETLEITIAYNG